MAIAFYLPFIRARWLYGRISVFEKFNNSIHIRNVLRAFISYIHIYGADKNTEELENIPRVLYKASGDNIKIRAA